jgi:3',5'-cyclic AMP phosphodiesterase CpdA
MRCIFLITLIASACSFSNTNQVRCTEDSDCANAFGAGAVCQSDGFCAGGSGPDGGGSDSGSDSAASWTFVSFPDFLNADIGDISALTTAVNSTNSAHETAIANVLDALTAEHPDFVMVAGDLVNGHWYSDTGGVFGPVGTLDEKRAAVTKASDIYYGIWKQRFADRGLPVYAALGDHDIGDNDWAAGQDRSFLVPTYKQQWAKHFTLDETGNPLFASRPVGTSYENTAYAVRHKNVLIVTVDVFHQDDPNVALDSRTGSVRTDVADEQLAWLDSVLQSAATDPQIDHVIVQGHVPVLLPVRVMNSSGMTMPGAADSEFWQTLSRDKVDLYFAGEVHDMSTANAGGVEQVVHGGIMGYAPRVSYLVGHVYPDRVELELKSADLSYSIEDTSRLWQAGQNRPRAQYTIGNFSSAGTLVIDKSTGSTQYLDRTGFFIPIGGTGTGLAVHLPLDEMAGTTTINRGTTGATNNGTIQGATFVPGKIGNALSFDNVDTVLAGAPPVMDAQARTTSVWIKAAPSSAIRTIFSFGTNTSGGKWDTDVDATGLYELGIAQSRTDATGSSSVADNTWHHLVTVLPQGATTLAGLRMYIDGNPISFTGGTTPIDTRNGNIIIGQSVNAQAMQQFAGSVDDFAIWSKDLDAGQVRALYSFANEVTLNYDASQVQLIFDGFAAHQDVMISGRLWRYQASGLAGAAGQVVVSDGTYAVNLGGGAGFVSP